MESDTDRHASKDMRCEGENEEEKETKNSIRVVDIDTHSLLFLDPTMTASTIDQNRTENDVRVWMDGW